MRASKHSQQGAVLIVSLILLLLITVIALSTMSSSTFQTAMVINAQQRESVFRTAESAAEQALYADAFTQAYNAYLKNGNAQASYSIPSSNLHTPLTNVTMTAQLLCKGKGSAATYQELSANSGSQMVSKIYESRGNANTSDQKVATQVVQGIGVVQTDSSRETYDP